MGGRDQKKVEEDYELFLQELEEDPELRATVNLYAAKDAKMRDATDGVRKKGGQYGMDVDEVDKNQNTATNGDEENAEEEADFPDVRLDELLENFDEMALEESGVA
ncbi:hypothetical protein AZE42_12357 [Rhizopogon vesiculosus]|uniref:Uncharacterized protein n=1 Tax=Rhizopogon vesiculosus TaxID=180088 RepID=A0A1J8R4M1_9AGAM|nr:hypothetical protein AZE42_12357 [Rhizopogon vesiculosus]